MQIICPSGWVLASTSDNMPAGAPNDLLILDNAEIGRAFADSQPQSTIPYRLRNEPLKRSYIPIVDAGGGVVALVRLEATRLPGRVLVPARAIIERDGRPLVFVVREGKAQWTYILPGRSNGSDTEVLPDSTSQQVPVAVGDTVVIEGHLTLTHDAPVRLVAQQEREE